MVRPAGVRLGGGRRQQQGKEKGEREGSARGSGQRRPRKREREREILTGKIEDETIGNEKRGEVLVGYN